MKNEEGIMKVMMLLSNPFMVDPRVYKEAKALVDVGHEVTVIVWDRKNEYESVSVVEGIRIVRIHNTGIMKILPLDLFKNPLWWRKAFKKALELYESSFRFDVVHCHDLDTLKSGVWLKNKLGIKLVYDAHEIFGYMVARTMPKSVSSFAFCMEKKWSITDKPITIVMNCNDVISKTYQPTKNDVCTISYIGVLHKSRMFPELVDIIGKIKNVRFVIAGKKENLYDEVKSRCEKYDNITFLGSIPFNEVIPKTLESDVVVCMINPNDMNNKIALANKQFEAIVCGRPIICTKNTYSGDMTEKLQCGLVVDYNLDAIKEAIIKLRDDPKLCEKLGRNGLKAAIDKYNWNEQKKKLLAICAKLN
jgi:glycosyltransferase involved in cell wall biosynthesis